MHEVLKKQQSFTNAVLSAYGKLRDYFNEMMGLKLSLAESVLVLQEYVLIHPFTPSLCTPD